MKRSLEEVNNSVRIYKGRNKLKRYLSFWGIGIMISVGYMDPGNWATDIAGGSLAGYQLLYVVLGSSVMAMILQFLSLKLGIVAEKDLAQVCKKHLPKEASIFFWILCEIAIIACDLAELLGAAIALQLLFDIPILIGVLITLVDVFIILYLQSKGFRYLESFVVGLVGIICLCFLYEIFLSAPPFKEVIVGFIPTKSILKDSEMLFIAVGILGATVMPHNLYLHSSIVQTRDYERTKEGKKMAIRYASLDSFISLSFAFFINAAILILSARVFHGNEKVEELSKAYSLLSPLLGDRWASVLFAIALLCAGMSSTVTGTLAGQVVMEGFINIRLPRWKRRIITRSLAIIPAFLVIAIGGEEQTTFLLLLSQVILSLQLSFAVIPLVSYTSSKKVMGEEKNSLVLTITAWTIGVVICGLNLYLLVDFIF